tara:strand:- start:17 stop:166 length:150 start_codon:yes stop_codon:yes gene_type:complete
MLDGGAFLNEDDIRFVNEYHQRVREELTVEVGESDPVFVARLNAATAPL